MSLVATSELFKSRADEAYATVRVGQHHETYPVAGSTFERYLARCYYRRHGAPPDPTALKSAVRVIEGHALFQGQTHDTFVRVGGRKDTVYLDLGNDTWDVIEVTRTGWRQTRKAPVKFTRPAGMRSLPRPESGGSIDDLRPFLNLASEDDFTLVVSFLVGALLPTGPYAHLQLAGEQGSGKSILSRVVRDLIDPHAVPLRGQITNQRDLMIAASNSWLLVLDNLSWLPRWLSDALCRLSTGGGFTTRRLYTDVDETLIDVQRPVLLNGIAGVAVRGDLLDRTISLELPALQPTERKSERQFWADFEKVRPRILGALLDAVSRVLKHRDSVELTDLPRLADFAVIMAAAEPAFGWAEGTFARAYQANQQAARVRAVESDSVAILLQEHMATTQEWSGTATELLDALKRRTYEVPVWVPRDPARLANSLRRLAPDLKAVCIDVTFTREGHAGTRMIHLRKREPAVSIVSTVSEVALGSSSGELRLSEGGQG